MTTDQRGTDSKSLGRDHAQIAGYLGASFLIYYMCWPQGGFADIPVQFLLKDTFKMSPEQMAWARLWMAAPTYVAFLFGFMRDRWSPFRKGDQGLLWIFGPLAALSFGFLALGNHPTYTRLLIGALSATLAYRFLSAVTQGLSASVGKSRGMTGRISTLWTIVWNVLAAASYMAGGWVSDHLTFQQTFAFLALMTMGYFAIGFWTPWGVFEGKTRQADPEKRLGPELSRLFRHWPVYPAAFIWLLWSFAPGFATPLTFYLTDHIKASDTQYGAFFAIFSLGFIPTFLLYGYLCRFVRLNKLLFWGTVFAVPQMIPLLFLKTPVQALWLAVPIGLSGGVATAAYIDLLMRSCPKGLEGTGMMIAETGYFIAVKGGDLFGSWLYTRGGFALTAWITTAVYAFILPVLLLVPRRLTRTHDSDEQTEEAMVDADLQGEPVAAR